MDGKSSLAQKIAEYDYLDLHIHLENVPGEFLCSDVLYFASSVNGASYDRIKTLSDRFPQVIPQFGIHPMKAAEESLCGDNTLRLVKECGLIGEIGLDFHWVEDRRTDTAQRAAFRMFLQAAASTGAPPVIHTKGAEEEILTLLDEYSIGNALIHWYSGPPSLLPAYAERGCFFTVGPDVLAGTETALLIPRDRLLCETDNPTGVPWITGGKPGGDDIKRVYRGTADLLGVSEEYLVRLCRENALSWLDCQGREKPGDSDRSRACGRSSICVREGSPPWRNRTGSPGESPVPAASLSSPVRCRS